MAWAFIARCWARQQIAYLLGSTGRSFVTGWGASAPARPHHRGAFCDHVGGAACDADAFFDGANVTFENVLPGGLVSGPTQSDVYEDDQRVYRATEVAVDYNAALVSGPAPSPRVWFSPRPFCLT